MSRECSTEKKNKAMDFLHNFQAPTPKKGEEQRRRRAADWILTSNLRQVSSAVAQGEREGGRYEIKMVGIVGIVGGIFYTACRSTLLLDLKN